MESVETSMPSSSSLVAPSQPSLSRQQAPSEGLGLRGSPPPLDREPQPIPSAAPSGKLGPPRFMKPVRRNLAIHDTETPAESAVFTMDGAEFWDREKLGEYIDLSRDHQEHYWRDLDAASKWVDDRPSTAAARASKQARQGGLEELRYQHFCKMKQGWKQVAEPFPSSIASPGKEAQERRRSGGRQQTDELVDTPCTRSDSRPPSILDASNLKLGEGEWFSSGVRPRLNGRSPLKQSRSSLPADDSVISLGSPRDPPNRQPRSMGGTFGEPKVLDSTKKAPSPYVGTICKLGGRQGRRSSAPSRW